MGTEESKDTSRKYFKPNETVNETIEDDYLFQPFVCSLYIPAEVSLCDQFPYPRSGHKIVCDEANFYSYGGYNPNHPLPRSNDNTTEDPNCLFPDVWKFNFARMKWKKMPIQNIPSALASNAVTLSGRLLIVYGGTGVPFHLSRSNKLYICNLDDKNPSFNVVSTTGQHPPALYGQAIFIRGKYFYAIGGTTGFDYFLDIHRLNLQTKQWEEVYIDKGTANNPPGRYRHELAVVNDNVYILGGGIGREAYNFETIPVYNLIRNKWDELISVKDPVHGYPNPRQYHSVVKIPQTDSFIMAGGLFGPHIFDDVWKIDFPSLQWTKIPSAQLATPVYFHASSVSPAGKMFTFGGVSKTSIEGQERVSHVQSAWICIPKLKEICWEAVIDYGIVSSPYPEFDGVTILPLEFRNRLKM